MIEPLLPAEPPKPRGGRRRVRDGAARTEILSVLKSGIPRGMLPHEIGCGSGITLWRRLYDRHAAALRERLPQLLLNRLRSVDQIDWTRASSDGVSVPAPRWGEHTCFICLTCGQRFR